MKYLKISESAIFAGVLDAYASDSICVDDELFEYILGLSGMIVYHGEFSENILTILDKGLFSTIDIVNEQPTEIEILQMENQKLKEESSVQSELIDITMMATDEIYTLIEPILASQPATMSYSLRSPMIDLYVAMIVRGIKILEQVPIKYRQEVQQELVKLAH